MAFSTQKDFLPVAFMNERPKGVCLYLDALTLKTYASTNDERAWSISKDKQAKYLVDLVECRMHPRGDVGDGVRSKKLPAGSKRKLRRVNSAGDQRSLKRVNSASSQRSLKSVNSTSSQRSLKRVNSISSQTSPKRFNSAYDKRSLKHFNSAADDRSMITFNSTINERSLSQHSICSSYRDRNKSPYTNGSSGKLTSDIGEDSVIQVALETLIRIERL